MLLACKKNECQKARSTPGDLLLYLWLIIELVTTVSVLNYIYCLISPDSHSPSAAQLRGVFLYRERGELSDARVREVIE